VLEVLEAASFELTDASAWYDERVAGLGDRLLFEIRNAFDFIARNPGASRTVGTVDVPHEAAPGTLFSGFADECCERSPPDPSLAGHASAGSDTRCRRFRGGEGRSPNRCVSDFPERSSGFIPS